MAKRAATIESKMTELTNEVARLKEELEMATAEKESGILATKKDTE